MHFLALVKVKANSLEEARAKLEDEFRFARERGVDYYIVIASIVLEEASWHFTENFVYMLEERFKEWHSNSIRDHLLRESELRAEAEREKDHKRRQWKYKLARIYKRDAKLLMEHRWVPGAHFIVIGAPDLKSEDYGDVTESGDYSFSLMEYFKYRSALSEFVGSVYYFVIDYHW